MTDRPKIGRECPRCGFVLRADNTLDRTPRSSNVPCQPCLLEAPDA